MKFIRVVSGSLLFCGLPVVCSSQAQSLQAVHQEVALQENTALEVLPLVANSQKAGVHLTDTLPENAQANGFVEQSQSHADRPVILRFQDDYTFEEMTVPFVNINVGQPAKVWVKLLKNGKPLPDATVQWTLSTSSANSKSKFIKGSSSKTDERGVVTATVTVTEIASEQNGSEKLTVTAKARGGMIRVTQQEEIKFVDNYKFFGEMQVPDSVVAGDPFTAKVTLKKNGQLQEGVPVEWIWGTMDAAPSGKKTPASDQGVARGKKTTLTGRLGEATLILGGEEFKGKGGALITAKAPDGTFVVSTVMFKQ